MKGVPGAGWRRGGFTLVEVMVVVVIIGLLAAIAIPAIRRVRERSVVSRCANDLRQMAQAFETFAMERGHWPVDAAPGATPPGMITYLPSAWDQPPVVGGLWEWDGEVTIKMITLYQPTAPVTLMLRIDRQIDDGVAATGLFRQNGTEWNYVLQELP